MVRLVTDYLDNTAKLYPEKIAFKEKDRDITYCAFREQCRKIATFFIQKHVYKQTVAIYMDKSFDIIASFMGCAYSGNIYTVMDATSPIERAKSIVENLLPAYIITEKKYYEYLKEEFPTVNIVCASEIYNSIEVDENMLDEVRLNIIDTDVLYILYTSGSTGKPKGAVLSHRAVIAYTEWASNEFNITSKEVLGNQTPFYFSMSVTDIYVTLRNACTLVIIPHKYFSEHELLIKYLDESKITMIYWVPSALSALANSGILANKHINSLKKILFAGEVMHTKYLNIWRKYYPDVLFANLFGPTETTDICTFYKVDRQFTDTEALPIGRPCENAGVFIIDAENKMVTEKDVEGELCVRGSFLAYGYYKNEEKTNAAFVQNPLNRYYKEMIYKTGDLVKYNEKNEIIYIGRKDFQIKINGYRIELGEIETAISSIEGVESSCCIYDEKREILICVYSGKLEKNDLRRNLKNYLPRYMMPHKYVRLEIMPINSNGKIDRKKIKAMILA